MEEWVVILVWGHGTFQAFLLFLMVVEMGVFVIKTGDW
jgi:hypothetical protein